MENDGQSRAERRAQLAASNSAATRRSGQDGDGDEENRGGAKLDTSLKRHTTFLTRLRTSLHTQQAVAQSLADIKALALDKYVEEAVGSVMDGLAKCKTGMEIWGAVEVISALHVRFPTTFTPHFQSLFLSSFKTTPTASATSSLGLALNAAAASSSSSTTDRELRDKEEAARVIRHRSSLRVLGELEAVKVIRLQLNQGKAKVDASKDTTGEVTFNVLKDLLTADKDKDALPVVAPIAVAFAKHLGSLYMPPRPAPDSSEPTPSDSAPFPVLSETSPTLSPSQLIPLHVQQRFSQLLAAFHAALSKSAIRVYTDLQRTDKRNHEAYIRSGEVFEDRERAYERSVKAWERHWSAVTQLSEILSLPPPVLPNLASTSSISTKAITGTGDSTRDPDRDEKLAGGPWMDDEERQFYEDLRELSGEVPTGILGRRQKKIDPQEDDEAIRDKENPDEADKDLQTKPAEPTDPIPSENTSGDSNPAEQTTNPDADPATSSSDPSLPSLPAGPAAQLTALLARLEDASSRSSIDQCALEFAFLNSKAARRRLVKFLAGVSRNRQELIPYYSRLVATLDPYMPDIGKELLAILDDEFKYLQRKRNTDLAETRMKNLKFISELTKFGITPAHTIFHVLKVLADDLTGPNVDNLATLLEGCGRFLLRTSKIGGEIVPGSSDRMRAVLEIVKRKMRAAGMDERGRMALENAYYQCDPPDRPVVVPKERTPMQLYIRHLFYNSLTRNSSDRILKLTRKLHWEDPAVVKKLHNAFTKVWKIKYSNVHLFAVLLYDLGRYHPDFSVSVIDAVLENIRVGLEVNSFKYNQQRVATVKYLGELYNYRVVDSRVVFDTLWTLVTFGHLDGRPSPEDPSPIDAPDDAFRIRLVCTLLDTCGSCFERGTLKKKLDNFLTFFQLYILSKTVVPMDVEFMVSDTLEQLRPHLVLFKHYHEAAAAVDAMMAVIATNGPVEEEVDEGEDDAEGVDGRVNNGSDHEANNDDGNEASSSGEEYENDENEDVFQSESEEDSRPRDPNAMTQEEEEEFARELSKMMVNTSSSAGGGVTTTGSGVERKTTSLLDVNVPVLRRKGKQKDAQDSSSDEEHGSGSAVRFALLTKKGAKQQVLSMKIPRESAIAMHTLEKRAQDKKEQEELKRRVLDYEKREESAEKEALKTAMSKRGVNIRFVTRPQ